MEKNATLQAKKVNGYIQLTISIDGLDNVSIKVNDFGGTQKKKSQKLTYMLYKKVGE